MASYFDPQNPNHTKLLLYDEVKDHPKMEVMAEMVEYEVINYYRERRHHSEHDQDMGFHVETDATPYENNPIQTEVMLNGYKEDADEAEANFRKAMLYTIAYVLRKVLRNFDNEDGLEAKTRGNRSWDFGEGGLPTADEWPKGWKGRLAKYNNTETLYHL